MKLQEYMRKGIRGECEEEKSMVWVQKAMCKTSCHYYASIFCAYYALKERMNIQIHQMQDCHLQGNNYNVTLAS